MCRSSYQGTAMLSLPAAGQQLINDVAQRHGFSVEATLSMLEAVRNGNGSMAQFNHPEFSGAGQWMRGGMTMVSDMFNNYLKGRVDSLCSELSNLLANQPELTPLAPAGGSMGSGGDWWPADLRYPNSTGAQNHVRYAYFAQARRLVIEVNGTVTVYDTLDHQIGGFSQQQSVGSTLTFSSQYGQMDVTSLPVVSSNGIPPQAPMAPVVQAPPPPVNTWSAAPIAPPIAPAPAPWAGASHSELDVFGAIERLAALHAKGILSDAEFSTKKTELLSRL
ncbi:hypothetical protein VITFI_CDS2332 [Vitreoscilla filiformis]|uniref:SHOCT domain-containing protein n=2 Tax=Vitreoscilla filiformis TaxID=63 RepID=A0A221KH30_VITFI|nr:hypothetical protein VITFI_CDS2332 [Vitreoscilla filiformis]